VNEQQEKGDRFIFLFAYPLFNDFISVIIDDGIREQLVTHGPDGRLGLVPGNGGENNLEKFAYSDLFDPLESEGVEGLLNGFPLRV
jgi:hypothetical protein